MGINRIMTKLPAIRETNPLRGGKFIGAGFQTRADIVFFLVLLALPALRGRAQL